MNPIARNATALAILAATFLARWPLRHVPLIRDEGELAQLAQGLRAGLVPYADLYHQKPPVAFGLVAVVQAVAGESIEALRIATTLWLLLGGALLWAIARRWLGDAPALAALAAFALLTTGQAGFFHQASTEVFALPFTIAGIGAWLVARRDPARAGAALAAGAAAALAYQTKQTGIALALAIALDTLASGPARSLRPPGPWRAALLAALGFAATTTAVLIVLAAQGALPAYLDATWWHNWAYVGARHGGAGAAMALPIATSDAALWLAGAAGLALLLVRERATPLRAVALLGATTFATAVVAGHDYAHYYVPVIVPLAFGIGSLARTLAASTSAPVAALVLGAAALPTVYESALRAHEAEAATAAVIAQAPTVANAAEVARYVAARTEPGEAVAVLGSEPQVSFLADRPPASRMVIAYPMSGGYPHSDALVREHLEALRERAPRFVVVPDDWRSYAEARAAADALRARLAAALAADHAIDRDLGDGYRVLRRIDAQAGDDQARPLLLLITADTLRADHLGAYGASSPATPALDELARESTRFTASYATAPYTLPSVVSLQTGRYPEELGILANHALFRGTQATVAERLRRHGWRTGAVVSNYVLRRGTGIEAGFELYDDRLPSSETNREQPERTATATTDAAIAALETLLGEPGNGSFLWVHYQDPHGPYLPPGERRERYLGEASATPEGARQLPVRGLNPIGAIPSYQAVAGRSDVAFYRAGYAGEIDYLDGEIGRLLQAVEERASREQTTVVFTADHGESLGEDDYWFAHGAFLSDALVRVPLLIRAPGRAPDVRDDVVAGIDLAPTLLAAAGVAIPGDLAGRDLLAPGARTSPSRAYLANLMGSAAKRWGWVDDGYVLVVEESPDGESTVSLRSIASGRPSHDEARRARMRADLDAFRSRLRLQPEIEQRLSPDDVEMLRHLGYVE